MTRSRKTVVALGALLITGLILGPAIAQESPADRKERILANLKLAYPQLGKVSITMGVIGPSEYEGLDEGSFVINGSQTQNFFVNNDDTKLYMIGNAPVDVSRTTEQIAAEVASRKAEAAKANMAAQDQLAAVIADRPFRGSADARVTIVEFSDFQCPYCSKGAATVEEILEKYPNDVKFVFTHFPLNFHPWAKPAAIASHCGGLQSGEAFWTLHDEYFKNQRQLTPQNVIAKSKEYLADVDIDMAAWTKCAEDTESAEYKAARDTVDAAMALGQKLGVSGTPGFFVNGQFLNGARPLSDFEPLITAALESGE